MSTRFTRRGTPMEDSQSLALLMAAKAVHETLICYVADALRGRDHPDISPSILNFLGALDCGINFGSDIARRLKVSRQMVAKTVKELCQMGYLEQVEARGKQKQILFTATGERLMSDVRQLLAQMDSALKKQVGATTLRETLSTLETIAGEIDRRLTQ